VVNIVNLYKNKKQIFYKYKQINKCLAWCIILFVKYEQFPMKNSSSRIIKVNKIALKLNKFFFFLNDSMAINDFMS
jgi:hypothetical protein